MERVKRLPKWAKLVAVAVPSCWRSWGCGLRWRPGPKNRRRPSRWNRRRPASEEEVPGAYLFQHFLGELHDCYRQIGQSISLPNLERQVGKEWGAAAVALMDYYRDGNCAERRPLPANTGPGGLDDRTGAGNGCWPG